MMTPRAKSRNPPTTFKPRVIPSVSTL
jgi:hypothetical protein